MVHGHLSTTAPWPQQPTLLAPPTLKERKWKTCYIEGEKIGLAPPHHHYRLVITNLSIYQHLASRPPMYSQIQICQSRPGHELQPPVLGNFKRHNEEKYETMRTRNTKQEVQNHQNHACSGPSPDTDSIHQVACRFSDIEDRVVDGHCLSKTSKVQRTKLACF
jgi:hypothetical protein